MLIRARAANLVWLTVASACLAACAGAEASEAPPATPVPATAEAAPVITSTTTSAPATTLAPTTTAAATTTTAATTNTTTSTTSTTTTSSTTTTPTTVPPQAAPTVGVGTELVPYRPLDLSAERIELGASVLGTPIVAERLGDVGGRRVLVIGVIHGNEAAGVGIVQRLRELPPPDGVELWLVESMNPDGHAIGDRHNANQVDLNRNFPYKWGPLGQPGDGQYAGTGAASEPETQAIVNFIAQLRPDIAVWYHQDLYTINPSEGRDGRIRARYAELTGLPMGEITGGTYTGIAATWARRELEAQSSVAFIVELGPTLSAEEADVHANAVLTIGVEG